MKNNERNFTNSSLTFIPPGSYLLASNAKTEYKTLKEITLGLVLEEIVDKSSSNLRCLKVFADNTLLIVWSNSRYILG